MVWPIYEFRPLPELLKAHNDILRYNEGKWTPDDGEYDLAFIWRGRCLMVDLPYKTSIIWQWYDKHWGSVEPRHPRGNAWHYALRDGMTNTSESWKGREVHLNTRAGNEGMHKAASMSGSANGSHIELQPPAKHILAGLVRERETGKVLMIPANAHCFICGDEYCGPHLHKEAA